MRKKELTLMIKQLIVKFLDNKLIRFFLVSGLNTAFGYGLFALLVFIGLHYIISGFISTIAGILFNFKTIGIIVFKEHNNSLIFRFFAVYGITYLCNIGGIALLKYVGFNTYYAGAILLIPSGLLAFILNRFFVFSVKN